jgi:hypothetical protein
VITFPKVNRRVLATAGRAGLLRPSSAFMAEEGGSEAAEANGEALDCKMVIGRVMAAAQARDWTGLLAWERRMEELIEQAGTAAGKEALLHRFAAAHCHTGGAKHAVGLVERRIDILRSLCDSGREGSAMVE